MAYPKTRRNQTSTRNRGKHLLHTRKHKRVQKGGNQIPYYAIINFHDYTTDNSIYETKNGIATSIDDLKERMIIFMKSTFEYEYNFNDIILSSGEFTYHAFINGNWVEYPAGNHHVILNLVQERYGESNSNNNSNNNTISNSNSNNNNNNNASNSNNIPSITIPSNAVNAISGEPIERGTTMVNFHNEKEHGRYYTKSTYNSLQSPKRNPFTRQYIIPSSVIKYKAT